MDLPRGYPIDVSWSEVRMCGLFPGEHHRSIPGTAGTEGRWVQRGLISGDEQVMLAFLLPGSRNLGRAMFLLKAGPVSYAMKSIP